MHGLNAGIMGGLRDDFHAKNVFAARVPPRTPPGVAENAPPRRPLGGFGIGKGNGRTGKGK